MNKKAEEMNNTLKIVGAVIMSLLFLGVVSVVLFLVLTTLTNSASSVTRTTILTNQTTGYVMNFTRGYIMSPYTNCVATVIQVMNTSGGICPAGNYTVTGCTITALTTASFGCNNTVWYITGSVVDSRDMDNINNNVTNGVAGFFTQIPTIMTILGIVALIGVIVLIIYFIAKMGGNKAGL